MEYLHQFFNIKFEYKVHFTRGLFDLSNMVLSRFLQEHKIEGIKQKILFIADKGVINAQPDLLENIGTYFTNYSGVQLTDIIVIPGGEIAKNDKAYLDEIIKAVNDLGIDRHSYLAAVGGGSVLDLAGFAAAISHRGIKHIRIPTTVLSQNDSGVGVKNGINFNGKKNFLGAFTPPVAVFNDEQFLTTLSDRDWRAGISEAIKVALIKDAAFFGWIEKNVFQLAHRGMSEMKYLIHRCAELHLEHICSGDPFETGSSRPLDFGHWSAHKLEQLTNFAVFHGEAVAMGIALDSVYSGLKGMLTEPEVERIIDVLQKLGFEITHPYMEIEDENSPVLLGLQEFREHLGGRLTITLLTEIGKGKEVHEMDWKLVREASRQIKKLVVNSF